MSGHIPAARARHQKYLLARLPRDNDGDDDDDDEEDGLRRGVTSVATITRTIPFPQHTITETEAVPVLVTVALNGAPTLIPVGPPVPIVGLPSPPDQPAQPQPSSNSSPASASTAVSSDSVASASSSSSTSVPSTPTSNPVDASSSSNTSPSVIASHNLSSTLSSSGPSSTISAIIPSNSGALDTTGTVSQPKGLSGGAIGGIVIAVLILAGVFTIYIVRKVFLRKRQNRRISWGAAVYPNFDEKVSEKRAPAIQPAVPNKHTTPIAISISAPQSSYNNPASAPLMSPPTPMRAGITSPTLVPAAGTLAVPLAPATSSSYGSYAFVRCTFIPNLPDELSITMGEMVRIVTEYDDGWALCQNGPGEQGVVPMECLDRGGAMSITSPGQYLGQGTGDWRMSRRASSLYANQNAGAPHL